MLNLALVDLLFCLFNLVDVVLVVSNREVLGGCQFNQHLKNILAKQDGWSIVLIGLTRAIFVVHSERWRSICERKRNVGLILMLTWAVNLLTYAPRIFWLDEIYEGKAECVHVGRTVYLPAYYLSVELVISVIILTCYHVIWIYAKKQLLSPRMKKTIEMAKTMAIISFSYILLRLPWFLTQLLNPFKLMDFNNAL